MGRCVCTMRASREKRDVVFDGMPFCRYIVEEVYAGKLGNNLVEVYIVCWRTK
jgi:hypothetical protein